MNKEDKFYITTPIYYPSGKWHIGTCYTTVICDAIARYKRMQNKDVFFLTGTDEHGEKVEKVAKEHGITPKEWVDKQSAELKRLWEMFDISYTRFIRTTDSDHERLASKIFDKLYEKGYIYKGDYESWYCVPCETFITEKELVNGKCPSCGREVTRGKEPSYIFALSKFQEDIKKLLEEDKEFLVPENYRNEMLNNFVNSETGLKDFSASRASVKWGIPISIDKNSTTLYVWIDALSNYITALGYGSDDERLFQKYWPADLQVLGRDIVRFHSLFWPGILMALGIELPKKLLVHGWLIVDGEKMSKSKNNVIDPILLGNKFGFEAIRYYLLYDGPFAEDSEYTNELLLVRINSDLVNTLGNLVKRTSAMIEQYFGGVIPAPCKKEAVDDELIKTFVDLPKKVDKAMDNYNVSKALASIFDALRRANKYIDETTPWVLNKEGNVDRLKTVMYNLSEAIRFATVLLTPFLTKTPDKIYASFPFDKKLRELDSLKEFGAKIDGVKVEQKDAIFNRIDIPKTLKEMEEIAAKTKKEAAAKKEEKKENIEGVMDISQIAIDDFAKVDLRVGQILTAEKVEGADKLLKFSVKVGEEERTIVSGIAKHYAPDELIGKEVIVVANLKPAKLRGIMSEGMLLCAVDGDKVVLITPMVNVNSGSKVC